MTWEEYYEIIKDAGAKYEKIRQDSLKEYYKIQTPAIEAHNKRIEDARKIRDKIKQDAKEEYYKNNTNDL